MVNSKLGHWHYVIVPVFALLNLFSTTANAAEGARPDINTYRWQEDWSFLADPAARTDFGDNLKYIPLDVADPKRYISLGITLRERYENKSDPLFGIHQRKDASYLLHRLELHADAHLTDQTRLFVQIENALAPDLKNPGSADANKLDLRLAFLDTHGQLGDGTYKLRVGRQEMAFDLQRFISIRDGANVRQAFDAIWADYEQGPWRISGFVSQPVQYLNDSEFDDHSNGNLTYRGMRAQRHLTKSSDVSIALSNYHRDNAHYLFASGNESRNNIDLHYMGSQNNNLDWDIEGLQQSGHVGEKTVNAWGVGSIAGYTFKDLGAKPRLSVQFDAASGNHNPNGKAINSFNPLFPNGSYTNLSGLTGFSNLIHLKPAISFSPINNMKWQFGTGLLWRETDKDAIYTQPNTPLPKTAGEPGKRTATYTQARMDWKLSRSTSVAIEDNYYFVSSAIRNAGGHNTNYLGTELKWGW